MTNSEISRILDKLAFFLSLQNENLFKINAYRRAARSIFKHPDSLEDMILADGDLVVIPGIGKIIAKKIEDLLIIGEKKILAPYRQDFPDSLFELTQIKGIGPKTILKMYQDHRIASLKDLRDFVQNGGKLGLSSSFEERILQFISR